MGIVMVMKAIYMYSLLRRFVNAWGKGRRETMKSVDLAGCQGNTAGVVPSGSWERRPCFCISSVPLKTVQEATQRRHNM